MRLDFQGPVERVFQRFEREWLRKPVFELFQEVVNRNPHKIAIKANQQELTYSDVYHQAIALAQTIKPLVTPGDCIGIALRNDAFFPVAMLAALSIGCPFVPMDISFPLSRNKLIVELSNLKVIVTSSDIQDVPAIATTILIDQLQPTTASDTFVTEATCESIAYIVYTSGSTGIPKGVFQNQQNLLHDIMQYTNSIHLSSEDRLSLLYSPSVSGGFRDIFGALLNGATLFVLNLKEAGLHRLPAFIKSERITIYHSIPNIFRTFLKLTGADLDLSSVRLIYLAGDRIFNTDVSLYKQFFSKECLLYVGIGATEIATIYRQWFIRPDTPIDQELIPLGYEVEEREMRLLSPEGQEVSEGETGEIVVYSNYLSLGYWNNPEQTATSFSEKEGLRIFKTGDLGRINSKGLLEFVGRKDKQVKIDGYRIEINEIEGRLMNHPSINRCAVLALEQNGSTALVAFFMSEVTLDENELIRRLSQDLPSYMVPKKFIALPEIPLLPNFKNDYAVLAEQHKRNEQLQRARRKEISLDTDDSYLRNVLRLTWTEFLDEQSFEQNSTWADAGGTSLNAVNFLVQLEATLGTTLPSEWISGKMRPLDIETYLHQLSLPTSNEKQRILYYFPPVTGMTENSRTFVRSLSKHLIVRIVNYPDFRNLTFQESNWEAIRKFIERQIPDYNQPNVGFLSNCNGGIVMGSVLGYKPLTSYWFVGIIDGHLSYRKPVISINFSNRLKDFLTRGNIVSRTNTFLYTTFPFYKHLTDRFRLTNSIPTDSSLMVTYLLTHNKSYFDGEVWYFKCDHSPYDERTETWKDACSKVHILPVKGDHSEMFEPENANFIVENILLAAQKT